MAKQLKTAKEIEALIMKAAAHLKECEGLTGVTVQAVDDERVDYTWTVSRMHNCDSRNCEIAIGTIVNGAQRVIDLQE